MSGAQQHLESIGLTPRGQRRYGMPDGSETTLEVTGGQIEFMGETTWGTSVFGEDTAEPLLDVTALESAGVEVDPRARSDQHSHACTRQDVSAGRVRS